MSGRLPESDSPGSHVASAGPIDHSRDHSTLTCVHLFALPIYLFVYGEKERENEGKMG